MQWHPTILSKLALVPQRMLAAYPQSKSGYQYQDDDFVIMFSGCTKTGADSCETQSAPYWKQWTALFAKS